MSILSVLGHAVIAACAVQPVTAVAPHETWPDGQNIRLIVASPFGGVNHLVAGVLANRLADDLGTSVLIENLPGASGSLGMDAVAKAKPDGLTLGFASVGPLTRYPHLNQLPYDAHRDIVPIVSVMYSPILLIAPPRSEVTDFDDLIQRARARPGALTWATTGKGSLSHFIATHIMHKADVLLTDVPYTDAGRRMRDALASRFTVMSLRPSPTLAAHLDDGSWRALAAGSPQRLAQHPEIPTLYELGFPEANLAAHFGIYAPAGTPDPIVRRINAAVNAALENPEVAAFLQHTNNVPAGGTPEAFAAAIAQEDENASRIIEQTRIKGDESPAH